ncbi:DUF433 domain-containing protein [Niabella pedocola]|uniref:DUF433 domain-containing protein n=1 Tax=Niabella pedocola TaxID=1752077 RepID=A0ABS8PWT3_9BACT|nr:DUF433 domain-containing protein [Niabella pedocola]MCD2425536.1 DUF433 domain-containing protein [Niabella pedocola]
MNSQFDNYWEDCNFEEQTIIVMDISSYIEIRPEIMMGKPVIKGTRITVEMILESLGAGETADNLLESYPRLTKEAISAALFFAVEALKTERIYPVAV